MVPGDGGAEESGVKVNLFRSFVGSKGEGAVTFMFAKKRAKKHMQIPIMYTFQVLQ